MIRVTAGQKIENPREGNNHKHSNRLEIRLFTYKKKKDLKYEKKKKGANKAETEVYLCKVVLPFSMLFSFLNGSSLIMQLVKKKNS